ncbi:MAG: hypothetical protein CMM00_01705 [Rhodopirellula sp.]|nr:hypothetical protein [Rhodopirellula sp.]
MRSRHSSGLQRIQSGKKYACHASSSHQPFAFLFNRITSDSLEGSCRDLGIRVIVTRSPIHRPLGRHV